MGEKATIESMIASIEELMNNPSDENTEEVVKEGDNQNGVKTDTEQTGPNEVIDEKEKERKRLEYEEKIKQRRLEREGMANVSVMSLNYIFFFKS